MKVQFLTTLLAVAATVNAAPERSRTFALVDLPSPHYDAGPTLFPGNVIAGYDGKYKNYTSESFSQYVLSECKKYKACTSCISYSGKQVVLQPCAASDAD